MDLHHVWAVWLLVLNEEGFGSDYLAVTVVVPFSCCLLHAGIESG